MKLPYKEFLLKQILSSNAIFYQDVCVAYVRNLGIKVRDFYEAYEAITNLLDINYCGEGFSEKGNYFVIDESETMFWFCHYLDALTFIGVENGTLETFNSYRKHRLNGYLLCTKDDIFNNDIDDMITNRKGIFCESRNIGFDNIDSAVAWLVNSGYAKNTAIAKRQLMKHLEGNTTLCYGMSFVKY